MLTAYITYGLWNTGLCIMLELGCILLFVKWHSVPTPRSSSVHVVVCGGRMEGT